MRALRVMGGPGRGMGAVLAAGLMVAGMSVPGAAQGPPEGTLGQPGYLVIEAARDTAAGFRWEAGPGPGRRSLVWEQGVLILPDSLEMEPFGPGDLGVSFTGQLAGTGASGRLVLQDGIYPVSEPIVLSDGRLELRAAGGEIEFRGARIRYRQASSAAPGSGSGLLLLAGMTLLIVVLLRRARLKAGERADS